MTFLQQPLLFPHEPNYDPHLYKVADCNTLAFHAICSWPQWVDSFLIIHGPAFSGKTHLAHVWKNLSNACFISMTDSFPPHATLIIDDLEPCHLTPDFFHFINRVREKKAYCLLLASSDPLTWSCDLVDLTSRLKAMVSIPLTQPDEDHLAYVFQKNLSDQQIRLSQHKIHRLLLNSERCYGWIKKTLMSLRAS